MQPVKINYKVYQGSTFKEIYRWESQTPVYLNIAAASKSAPCVITTTTTPRVPTGWRVRVQGVQGMKDLNSAVDTYYLATAVNAEAKTITLNQVNSEAYQQYTTGGTVEYNQPVDLTGVKARLQVRETLDSDLVLYSASSQTGEIVIDTVLSTVTWTIPAQVSSAFTFTSAVYGMELYTDAGMVTPFITGNLTLQREVVR